MIIVLTSLHFFNPAQLLKGWEHNHLIVIFSLLYFLLQTASIFA